MSENELTVIVDQVADMIRDCKALQIAAVHFELEYRGVPSTQLKDALAILAASGRAVVVPGDDQQIYWIETNYLKTIQAAPYN